MTLGAGWQSREGVVVRKSFKVAVLLASSLALAHCTHTYVMEVNPNFFREAYEVENEISTITPAIRFSKGDFVDIRENKEYPGTLEIGPHTYNLVTKNDFSDAFYDGLRVFLVDSNQLWVESEESDIEIAIELLKTESDFKRGFSVVRFESGISARLAFIDSQTDHLIYQETYDGSSQLRTPAGHTSMVKRTANRAIVDCLNKMGMDKDLYKALMETR
jgi:hypothetical protein